jgi:hypothetical protein
MHSYLLFPKPRRTYAPSQPWIQPELTEFQGLRWYVGGLNMPPTNSDPQHSANRLAQLEADAEEKHMESVHLKIQLDALEAKADESKRQIDALEVKADESKTLVEANKVQLDIIMEMLKGQCVTYS